MKWFTMSDKKYIKKKRDGSMSVSCLHYLQPTALIIVKFVLKKNKIK